MQVYGRAHSEETIWSRTNATGVEHFVLDIPYNVDSHTHTHKQKFIRSETENNNNNTHAERQKGRTQEQPLHGCIYFEHGINGIL